MTTHAPSPSTSSVPGAAARADEAASPLLRESRPVDGVAIVRLHRPEVLNAMNLALRHALADAMHRLDADDSVRVVVLAGSARAFCAGADLNEYVDATPSEIAARGMGRLWDAIAACRKPVIAAVQGHALGGGCELAMHADLIVAARSARFGQPEVLIGLMPGGGATQRLVRAVGKFHAMRLLMTGAAIDADEALRIGLVGEVVDDNGFDAHVLARATTLAALPASALQAIKAAVLEGMDTGLSQGLRSERRAFQLLFDTPDKTEGIRARLEKRAAVFNRAHEDTRAGGQ